MSFDVVVIFTVERNDFRIHLCGITKSEVVSRVKNADFSEKKMDNFDYDYDYYLVIKKKKIIIVMPNNALETMTKLNRFYEKKGGKKEKQKTKENRERSKQYYED